MLRFANRDVLVNTGSSTPQEMQALVQNTPTSAVVSSAPTGASCDAPIAWQKAKDYVDQQVAVLGTVVEYRYLPKVNGSSTWINLGAKYPNKNRFSVVVWGDYRSQFGRALSSNLVSRQICVIGVVKLREGVPQMSIKRAQELVFK